MKKPKLTLTSVLLLAGLSLTTPAQSALLVDKSYTPKRLEQNECVTEQDKEKLGINPYQHSQGVGTQANFRTEKDLFELISKFYTCNNSDEDGIMYMLTFNNKKEDGSIRTIMYSLTTKKEDIAHMPKSMKLYNSIDEVLNHEQYQSLVKKIGEENIFFEGVDVENYRFMGLFDTNKTMLVSPEEDRKKYNLSQ
ncbi:MAG: hypothetical protein PF569_06190 [Candidatus Woesearchaeota archaeon]|jgi:hypothetical protein|nr:hypothetical protein [Candidatus Woesearchaeota archaeon]